MSANFYNSGGKMVGLDLHDYVGSVPPLWWVPVPAKALHFVIADFDGKCADEATRPANVTASGKPMLQGGFKRERVVPHLPVLPIPMLVPHFLEVLVIANLIAFSGSTATLTKGTVTGAGKPLAICIKSSFGTNLNCADPCDMPTDLVYNENSVKTEPSASDFKAALVNALVGGVVSVIVGQVFDKLISAGPEKLVNPVRKYLEDKLKDVLNQLLEDHVEESSSDKINATESTLASMGFARVG